MGTAPDEPAPDDQDGKPAAPVTSGAWRTSPWAGGGAYHLRRSPCPPQRPVRRLTLSRAGLWTMLGVVVLARRAGAGDGADAAGGGGTAKPRADKGHGYDHLVRPFGFGAT